MFDLSVNKYEPLAVQSGMSLHIDSVHSCCVTYQPGWLLS